MDATPFDPDWTIAPAETLREIMTERGLTIVHLAGLCATPTRTATASLTVLRAVLNREPYSEEAAAVLAKGTDVPAAFWLRLETSYRDALAAGKTDMSEK